MADGLFFDRLSGILTDTEWKYIVDARKGHPVAPAPEPPPAPGIRKLVGGVTHEYSTMYPGNLDHRAILLQHPGGFYGLHFADGTLFKMLPAQVNHSSQPRWSRKKPTVFRYLYLNELREFDVANDSTVTIRKFKEFPSINGMGESDTSEDDDHLVLCSGQDVFVYEISTDKIMADFVAQSMFNNLYVDSQNRPIVGFNKSGVQIFDNGKLRPVAAVLGHMDVSSDVSGNPVMVWANSADDTGKDRNAALANCKNGIVKIDLNTGKQTCLAEIDWSLACHISLPDRASFALVTTYDGKGGGDILKVLLDGSGTTSLAKHGSMANTYETQPKASVSPDGTRYIYDSNGDVFIGTL